MQTDCSHINYQLNRTSLFMFVCSITIIGSAHSKIVSSSLLLICILTDVLENQLYLGDQSIGLATTCAIAFYDYLTKKK